ncbi:MAG: hypothetical protein D6698_17435 [Gammaproteobacteria bacterium]|nr:MAG: hypothetical protein D6698_17435 [Gammaproteobacteria bacterium]
MEDPMKLTVSNTPIRSWAENFVKFPMKDRYPDILRFAEHRLTYPQLHEPVLFKPRISDSYYHPTLARIITPFLEQYALPQPMPIYGLFGKIDLDQDFQATVIIPQLEEMHYKSEPILFNGKVCGRGVFPIDKVSLPLRHLWDRLNDTLISIDETGSNYPGRRYG